MGKLKPIAPQPLPQPGSPVLGFLSQAPPGVIVQRGIATTSFAAASAQSGNVTFPFPFPSSQPNPVIILTIEVGANLDINVNVVSRSLTGFAWRWFQNTGVAVTGSLNIHWAAYSAAP